MAVVAKTVHGMNATLVASNTGYNLYLVTEGRKADLKQVLVTAKLSGDVQVDIYDAMSGGAGLSGVALSGFLKARLHTHDKGGYQSGVARRETEVFDNLLGITFISSIHVITTVSGTWIHAAVEEY